jgi:hypothetical protein
MGEFYEQNGAPDERIGAESGPETAEDEFYHQAVILDQCFKTAGLSPRMQEKLERMEWERTAAAAKRARRQSPRSA